MSLEHNVIHKVLPNGISLVMIPLKNTAAVTAMVFMGVGSRYESDDQRGLAHFTEHMVFKGGNRYTSTQAISQALDGIGGEFNAFTSQEYTAFYTKTASEYLELGLDIMSDMLLNAQIPPDELKKEKGVIVEELNMYEDIPMRKVDEVHNELIFGDTPLGRPIIGTKESVTGFTDADFHAYLKDRYVAAECTIAIAGSFEPDEAEALATRYFEKMPEGKAYEPVPFSYATGEQKVAINHRKSEQSHMILSVRAFSDTDPRRPALRVLSSILGGNMSSRLFLHVREEQGLCYYVRSSTDVYSDTGIFCVSAGIDNTRLNKAVEAILNQMRLMRDEGISDEELKRAKQYLIGHTLLGMEDSANVAEYYASQDRIENKRETPAEVIAKIEAVTADQVKKLAGELFVSENLRLAVVGPQEDSQKLHDLLTF